MITILYHALANGRVVRRIAAASQGAIRLLCDKEALPHKVDGTLVRWDSTARLPADRTINSADATKLSRDKKAARIALKGLCPTTWTRLNDVQTPCVVRPKKHFAANNFFVCRTRAEVAKAIKQCGYQRWYATALIDKAFEYRVFCFNGEVFKVVRRFHHDPNVVAWNIANDGKVKRILKKHWPEAVTVAAIDAGKRLGLDLYAADVIVDKQDKPYVLELNTAPGLDRDQTLELYAEMLMAFDQEHA